MITGREIGGSIMFANTEFWEDFDKAVDEAIRKELQTMKSDKNKL